MQTEAAHRISTIHSCIEPARPFILAVATLNNYSFLEAIADAALHRFADREAEVDRCKL